MKRKNKLIERRLQMKFAGVFLATAGILVLIQVLVLGYLLRDVASALPHDEPYLKGEISRIVSSSAIITFSLLAPCSIAIGIITTFRVLGPIHRFKLFLSEIIEGKPVGTCKIRTNDELQEFCGLLNQAVTRLREAAPEPVESIASPQAEQTESAIL